MPNFTKRAIKESFWKLLNEKPLSQISVRAIVEDCGINRNSFYYHFQDIPSLIEEIVMDAANALISEYPNISSFEEAVEVAFRFTLNNKTAVKHICSSVNRDIYEQYLMKICEYVANAYFNTVFCDREIDEQKKKNVILFAKCEIFGLFIDWINTGMPDDAMTTLKQIVPMCSKMIKELIENTGE